MQADMEAQAMAEAAAVLAPLLLAAVLSMVAGAVLLAALRSPRCIHRPARATGSAMHPFGGQGRWPARRS
jgi:hypothetical protein